MGLKKRNRLVPFGGSENRGNRQLEYEDDEPAGDSADLLPEFCHYRDEGCELAVSCLNCPFDVCIDEEPGRKHSLVKSIRDTEMARLYIEEGKRMDEIARMFGVSRRTVRRAVKQTLTGNQRRL